MSPRRTAAEQANTPVEDIVVGDVDPMSKLARHSGLPLCSRRGCTRVAGHHEGSGTHPSLRHVSAAAPRYIAEKVW